MDKEKARILINKINGLYKNIDANTPGVSPLERDLMLSYLRQFYELIALSPTQQKQTELKKEPVFHDDEKKINPVVPKSKPQEVRIEEKTVEIPPLQKEISTINQPESTEKNGSLDFLFVWQEPSNLAERLASQPISSLSLNSFSMNERLLYTNDLFHKQSAEMEEVIKMINNFTSFDQAKLFLLPLGEQYDWQKEERREAARSFINTVRRRFL
ncbi:MAG: hypothetical protein ACKOZZ_01735 [Bacteroidota bacterium]